MPTTRLDIEQEFRAILPAECVRAATAADAVAGIQAKVVLEPASEEELAAALRLANEGGLAVVPRGGGTKLGWGNAPRRADVVLSTTRLDGIIEHAWADLTVSVEAGCRVQKLQSALAKHGQRLALDALWPERATVGGILSTNDSGALRLRFGGLRDLIIGVTLALPDGTLASSGGKVVKNVAGYDLPKLVTGALGTLAVIARAVFRLHPLPRNAKTLTISGCNVEAMERTVLAIQNAQLAHTALQSRIAQDAEPLIDILFEGTEAGIRAQEAQLKEIARPAEVNDASSAVWGASQELWGLAGDAALAKVTMLPAALAGAIGFVQGVCAARKTRWKVAMQATGIGWLRIEGAAENLHEALAELRQEFERNGGALTLLRAPAEMAGLDAWGQAGDALPLTRAVKSQFDPKSTLNPGRFVGGI